MDVKDRLVLNGVRVTNFINIENFELIFLHNTHFLSVSVSLFVCLFVYLSVSPVCLYVCLLYSTVGLYSMCE